MLSCVDANEELAGHDWCRNQGGEEAASLIGNTRGRGQGRVSSLEAAQEKIFIDVMVAMLRKSKEPK